MTKTNYQKDEKIYYLSSCFFKDIFTNKGLLKPYNLKDYIRERVKYGRVSNTKIIYDSIEVFDYSEHEWVNLSCIAKKKEELIERVYNNIINFFNNIKGETEND